jgi:hypothetical protein
MDFAVRQPNLSNFQCLPVKLAKNRVYTSNPQLMCKRGSTFRSKLVLTAKS